MQITVSHYSHEIENVIIEHMAVNPQSPEELASILRDARVSPISDEQADLAVAAGAVDLRKPPDSTPTEPRFENFCSSKKITGNYKEAFYHHLMAKYAEYDQPAKVIDFLKTEEYEAEWKIVLSQILVKFTAS